MSMRDSFAPRSTSFSAGGHGGSGSSYNSYINATQLDNISRSIHSVSLSCAHLEDTNAFLSQMSTPYARLSTVLNNKRHFDLVSETEILNAREHLSAEIQPQLTELMDKAKESLEREERDMKTLRNKVRGIHASPRSEMIFYRQELISLAFALQQTLQQQAQLEEMGIKLDAAIPATFSSNKSNSGTPEVAASFKAAEKEAESLKKQVAALRKKREVLTRAVEKLEQEVEGADS